MYPEDSECFNQNNSQPESNDLFKLGETDDREYLGSKQQVRCKKKNVSCESFFKACFLKSFLYSVI